MEWIEITMAEAIAKWFHHYLTIGHTIKMEACTILLLEGYITGVDLQSQGDIGWKNTLEGKLDLYWKGIYEIGQRGCFRSMSTAWKHILCYQTI